MTRRRAAHPSPVSKVGAPLVAGAMRRANAKDLSRLKDLLEGREP